MDEKAGKAPIHWPLRDFLRATAALLVLLGHTRRAYFNYTDVLAQPGLFLKLFYFITSLEAEAVVVFFVLSGFLIGGSLADSMQRGRFDLVRYLIARFVRIYIVFIPALVITEAVFLLGARRIARLQLPALEAKSCPVVARLRMGAIFVCPRDHRTNNVEGFSRSSPGRRHVCLRDRGGDLRTSQGGGRLVHRLVPRRRRVPHSACGARPAPGGALGAGLMIGGMTLRLLNAAELETDTIIAVGTAIVIACRPMVAFPLASRFFGWAAGFS
jgi:hypothetical protein